MDLQSLNTVGDGTFRKSPHLWRNFRPRTGLYLHSIQLQIALASIDLLSRDIGGCMPVHYM